MTALITADERSLLLANCQTRADGQDTDPLPMVRLFTSDAHATWLLASLDPASAAAVGIPATGRRQRLDHRLSATAKRGALRLFRSGL